MRVFLSYSWQDEALRRAVADSIGQLPLVEVVFDQRRIKEGDSVHPTISDLIDSSDLVVALVTPASLKSCEVADELARANERKKRIVPFVSRRADLAELPFYLTDTLRVEYEMGELDKKMKDLVELVRKKAERRPTRFFHRWRKGSSVHRPDVMTRDDLQRSSLGSELLEQTLVYCQVVDFAAPSLKEETSSSIPLFICPNVFVPDEWTSALVKGVANLISGGQETIKFMEIGVGTGAVPIALAKNFGMRLNKLVALDIDSLACEAARINLSIHGLGSLSAIISGIELAEAIRRELIDANDKFDLIVANIPQVPATSRRQIRDYFDYYALPVGEVGEWDIWAKNGLWLVADVLRQSKVLLAKGGRTVFVVSGRPTLGHVLQMYDSLGYAAEVVFKSRVQQDPSTDISSFVAFERSEQISFEFYTSSTIDARIGAAQAHRRLLSDKQVYQELFVISGYPRNMGDSN